MAMELIGKNPIAKNHAPSVKWFKEWVPQENAITGCKCYLLKWVTEDMLKTIKEKFKEPEPGAPEPEPATEVLFLCSYQGCGKTFIDAGALKKHSHIHEEKQYVCHHAGCGRKFLDSSKLKRHFLIHTGERSFVCPHEGCGKAFSLDFNLKAHMRTHSQENYHICPYEGCRKRYAHGYKLRGHINAHHEKQLTRDVMKRTSQSKRIHNPTKAPVVYATPTPERPYACPYGGCGKAYIHEYKLNLHLRREHAGHNAEETGKPTPIVNAYNINGASDYDGYPVHRDSGSGKKLKGNKPKLPSTFTPPTKVAKGKGLLSISSAYTNVIQPKYMPATTMNEDDSEETEEERENLVEGWENGGDKEDGATQNIEMTSLIKEY